MRLQKYIADSGVASRRAAERMIEEGRVKVNGEIISQMGYIVQPEDEVLVDDAPIAPIEEKHYIIEKN